ncbi:hypothetical protein [Shimazuella alba]|uniref:Uncharacterized protein n=1 Tax=Shimazuella alba TaxID=2690964 RepID=A0A6I4VQM0_9BACL|nr:hypothetical protein [Shimazuella alba]MXQ53383.1 hypothetical protein [Shimazuella alba]
MAEQIKHANLDVLTRKCGTKALTIVVSGNSHGLQEYVDSTVWCINDMNQSHPATVRSVYGGPLEHVTMELSEQALDEASEGKVLGEISMRYMQEASSNKIIIISNPWGNTQLAGLISSYSSFHNRYVHQVLSDYRELRHAILAEEASGADYKVLDKFRNKWHEIRECGDSFAEVFRDSPVSKASVREYSVDGNLELLVSISSRVREAIRLQNPSMVVKLYPDLLQQLLKKQKILEVWVGSSVGIVEELESLEAARREVWEFWGSRNSPIILELLQSLDWTNGLVRDLQSAEETAKSTVALARDRVYSRNHEVSPQEAIDAAMQALRDVKNKATTISTFTESTYTNLKNSEAPDSERLMDETWSQIEAPEQFGHVITSDVKDYVDRISYNAKKRADRALAYVTTEKTALKLFSGRKR